MLLRAFLSRLATRTFGEMLPVSQVLNLDDPDGTSPTDACVSGKTWRFPPYLKMNTLPLSVSTFVHMDTINRNESGYTQLHPKNHQFKGQLLTVRSVLVRAHLGKRTTPDGFLVPSARSDWSTAPSTG
jgi:hypothetical protein